MQHRVVRERNGSNRDESKDWKTGTGDERSKSAAGKRRKQGTEMKAKYFKAW